MTVDQTIKFFQRRKQQCEELLKHAQTPPFKLIEMTPGGQQDITAAHIERLKGDRDTYQQAIDYLLATANQ